MIEYLGIGVVVLVVIYILSQLQKTLNDDD